MPGASTHIVGGLLAGAVLAPLLPYAPELQEAQPIIILAGSLAGGLLPDICSQNSILGQIIQPVSKKMKHRGWTHSWLVPPVILVASIFIPNFWYSVLVLGVSAGWASHLILDKFFKNNAKKEKWLRYAMIVAFLVWKIHPFLTTNFVT
jgi:membrane-bound metal-dependent hydrolase YbcI (DUF457 family)